MNLLKIDSKIWSATEATTWVVETAVAEAATEAVMAATRTATEDATWAAIMIVTADATRITIKEFVDSL